MPTASIIIPCYKQAEYLTECLNSLACQSFKDWEALVIDDGSPDNTAEIAQNFSKKNPKLTIKIIRQENQGLPSSRNTGLQRALGKYVLPLDCDDQLSIHFLENAVNQLDRNPEYDFAIPAIQEIEGNTRLILPHSTPFSHIIYRNSLPYSCLFRKEVLLSLNGYNPSLFWGYEDWELWIRCYKKGLKGIPLNDSALHYRVKPDSMLSHSKAKDSLIRSKIVLLHPDLYSQHEVYTAYQNIYNFLNKEDDRSLNLDQQYHLQKIIHLQSPPEKNECETHPNIFYHAEDQRENRLNQVLNYSAEKASDRNRIYVWGAGHLGTDIASRLKEKKVPISGFIDADDLKQSSSPFDLPVHSPDLLTQNYPQKPFIIIGSSSVHEIHESLLNMGYTPKEDYIW